MRPNSALCVDILGLGFVRYSTVNVHIAGSELNLAIHRCLEFFPGEVRDEQWNSSLRDQRGVAIRVLEGEDHRKITISPFFLSIKVATFGMIQSILFFQMKGSICLTSTR